MDVKQEPDYKRLYIDALSGLEKARGIINEAIRHCKNQVGGDYYLEYLQTHGIVTHDGVDLTDEMIKRYKDSEERAYQLD